MTTPLTGRQLAAALGSGGRELGWGLRAVGHETERWRRQAHAIPDARLRAEALRGLDHRRGHIDGAALLWTLPSRRSPALLRLLVAFEVMQDFLDGVSEHGARAGADDGTILFSAVADALDPSRPQRNGYYADLPWRDDGGYLAALVSACRNDVQQLPSFSAVRALLVREGERTGVLWRNHLCDPRLRDDGLRAWTAQMLPADAGLPWHELAAAASGWITTLVLLALAAEPRVSEAEALETYETYFPYVALALTLLDSWADQFVDAAAGDHSYIAHYDSREQAVQRLCAIVERARADVVRLRHGERHAVVLACMVALYATERDVRTPELKPMTDRVVAAGGTLTQLLMPALELWRLRTRRYRATH